MAGDALAGSLRPHDPKGAERPDGDRRLTCRAHTHSDSGKARLPLFVSPGRPIRDSPGHARE